MAQDPEKGDSVYDFLYVDARRIAVFLSQFGQYGHLTSLTRAELEASSTSGGLNPSRALRPVSSRRRTRYLHCSDHQVMAEKESCDKFQTARESAFSEMPLFLR